jgi:hypothetical protein
MDKQMFDNIGITPSHPGWVYLWWENAGKNCIRAVKSLRMAETVIKQQGLSGWLTSSQLEHTTMHKILVKLGAEEYTRDKVYVHFKKAVS